MVRVGMPLTEAGLNTDITVKKLLALLVKKGVLKQKEVDHLESTKTHSNVYAPHFIDY
ncbi:MAG: hypothetical protein WA667_20735 [Candidatus Nitrosopolaris sp.]